MLPDVPRLKSTAEEIIRCFAHLPLSIGDDEEQEVVGLLTLVLEEPFEFDEDRQAMLRLFADQAAIALQAARVHRRRLREQEALAAISELAAAGSLLKAWGIIAERAIELTDADYVSFWSLDSTGTRLVLQGVKSSGPGWPSPIPTQPFRSTIKTRRASTARFFCQSKNTMRMTCVKIRTICRGMQKQRAAFCMPLFASDQLIGTLYAASEHLDGFTEDHKGFIRQMAPHTAIALHNARSMEREKAFQEVVGEIHKRFDLREVCDIILKQLQIIVPYTTATLQLVFGDNRKLLAHQGFDLHKADPKLLRPLSKDPLVNEIVSSGKLRISRKLMRTEGGENWPGLGRGAVFPCWSTTKWLVYSQSIIRRPVFTRMMHIRNCSRTSQTMQRWRCVMHSANAISRH